MDDRRANIDEAAAELSSGVDASARYHGLRMTAAEYETLPEDPEVRYELIDGVVVMAPSPGFPHQRIASQIERQIENYLERHPIGMTARETDVTLNPLRVCRPDLAFLSKVRYPHLTERIHAVPDMVLEVLSPKTRGLDLNTKRSDYERCGVTEYWIVDPQTLEFTFLRLSEPMGGKPARYERITPKGAKFKSKAIPGFTLDIAAVKRAMRG